ncbi:MAG: helix-turn-helix transcriptional regulator [Propionibacteriaceae bacterium]|nr:helix-turn-helix transcriptional regulator [Propionibacteriaceae bacterium]
MATPRIHAAGELGDLVREARLAQGLSQTELAAEAAVGRQWLVGLEAGDKASAPLGMVLRVLHALALDVTLAGSHREERPQPERPPLPSASDILSRYEKRP